MKIKKHAFIECELKIDGITLLSIEEYEACREYIPPLNDLWWLRSPGRKMVHDAVNVAYGLVDGYGLNVESDLAVRPALKITDIKSAKLKLGGKFDLFGYTWTVISDSLALCDSSIGRFHFRSYWRAEDANDYEASNVKKYVEGWLAEQMTKVEANAE